MYSLVRPDLECSFKKFFARVDDNLTIKCSKYIAEWEEINSKYCTNSWQTYTSCKNVSLARDCDKESCEGKYNHDS